MAAALASGSRRARTSLGFRQKGAWSSVGSQEERDQRGQSRLKFEISERQRSVDSNDSDPFDPYFAARTETG